MSIRKTELADLSKIMEIYDYAKAFMKKSGNANQWINGYPSSELISREIIAGHSFVCENEEGEIVGTFCYIEGVDHTYIHIYEGEWLNDDPYGVIHRMASNGKQKNISSECMEWCFNKCNNIRVDTHRDNVVMQSVLNKHGFTQCGIIYVDNGTERLAFHKVVER